MATDEDAMPGGADFEVGTARMVVRPDIDEYPDTDDEPDVDLYVVEAPGAALAPLAPRARNVGVLAAVRPHRGRDDEVPVGRHVLRRKGGRWPVPLAAGGAILVLAAGVVMASIGGRLAAPGSLARAEAPVPGSTQPGSTQPGSTQPADSIRSNDPSVTTQTSGPAATGSTGTPLGAPQPPAPTGPAGTPDVGAPTSQPGPMSAPPAVPITGRIANPAGLCLSMTSGDRVRLWDCDSSAGQVWTLGSDGTLGALDRCVQPAAGLVRLQDCDGSPAQQWRVGPALSLVNSASGSCLGDPQAGTTKGTPERTAPCDQSAAQRWTVPEVG